MQMAEMMTQFIHSITHQSKGRNGVNEESVFILYILKRLIDRTSPECKS